jgi:hypothetical protein
MDLFLGGEDEEQQGMPQLPHIDQILQIDSQPDGGASVVELKADEDGKLYPSEAGGRRHFRTVEEAVAFTGRTGFRTDGALVAVIYNGQLV